jgi:hypothetical protein
MFSQEKLAVDSEFPVLSGDYFGQKPPGNLPEIFAPGIISTENGWEAAITFSPDGQKVFYNSERPKPERGGSVGEIWYSEKKPSGWSDAKYLTETINKGWIMFVTASKNKTLYFTGGFNRIYGVYKSEFVNGEYQEPEYLSDEINYLRGAHPYIAPDESYLIFDAQPDGMGKSQLFISFKDGNDNWTRAKKFDDTINASYTENIPNVSPDGKYFFFHRNNDIYWVNSMIIEKLKQEELKQ